MLQRQTIAELVVRPYIRRELPGWGRLYKWLVGSGARDAEWAGAGTRQITGKLHGYRMELDISNWSQRYTYFLGRYYDLPTQLLLQAVLKPGDRFCDIGANVGMISLLAARLVGPTGRVDSFEPNPTCAAKIRALREQNRLEHVFVHGVGLSDRSETLTLTVPLVNSGEGSFAPSQYDPSEVTVVTVDVVRADDPIGLERPPALIKIDVEGFECRVVDGLTRTLQSSHPLLVTEVVGEHLQRAGASVDALFERMSRFGYSAYAMGSKRNGLKHVLSLTPGTASTLSTTDVFWVHPPTHGDLAARVTSR